MKPTTRKHECYNCGYKTNCEQYTPMGTAKAIWLCHICSNTQLANSEIYGGSYTPGETAMMKGIAYIGNLLLDNIKK